MNTYYMDFAMNFLHVGHAKIAASSHEEAEKVLDSMIENGEIYWDWDMVDLDWDSLDITNCVEEKPDIEDILEKECYNLCMDDATDRARLIKILKENGLIES